MSRRPGESNDNGFGTFLGIAAGIGVGALLFGAYKATAGEEPPQQINDTDTIIADSEAKCRNAAATIRKHCNDFEYLGLECLWTNYPHNRRDLVGLLILATSKGFCTIIRLCDLQNRISTDLRNVLNDKKILKVGIGIDQKAIFLEEDHHLTVRGTLELSILAGKANIPQRSLAELAEVLCGINVKKSKALADVDWNRSNLTSVQEHYAKNCAISAIKIFEKLRDKIINLQGEEYYDIVESNLADKN